MKPSSYEIFSHPLINNRCTGMNSAVKLFTQLPPKPSPSYSYNYLPFPQALLIPLTSFIIPHIFPFMHCTKINNYSLLK